MASCSMDECCGQVVGRGLCKFHWQRARRAGFTEPLPPKHTRMFLDAALIANTKACIVWPYCIDSRGYGVIEGKRAHRIACEARNGQPTKRKPLACHSCGNRACINPGHLYWGTYKSNAEDSVAHGTTARGERNANAKLTEDDIRAIRASPLGGRRLGKQYGVYPSLIWSIRHRLIWAHVT